MDDTDKFLDRHILPKLMQGGTENINRTIKNEEIDEGIEAVPRIPRKEYQVNWTDQPSVQDERAPQSRRPQGQCTSPYSPLPLTSTII